MLFIGKAQRSDATDYEKEAMQRVGRVDLALAAVAADVLQPLTINRALEYLRTYKPTVYIPAHHDDNVKQPVEANRADLPGAKGPRR